MFKNVIFFIMTIFTDIYYIDEKSMSFIDEKSMSFIDENHRFFIDVIYVWRRRES